MKLKGFILGILIGLCFMIPLLKTKKENEDLKKQINKLKQENIDYKWQLDQTPYIIRYWCSEK